MVWSDQGLALKVVDEVGRNRSVVGIKGSSINKEVEDSRENGDRGYVGLVLNARNVWMVEGDRNPEIANVAVLVCTRLRRIFLEGLSMVANEDNKSFVSDTGIIKYLHKLA